jgi:hypothetical protein
MVDSKVLSAKGSNQNLDPVQENRMRRAHAEKRDPLLIRSSVSISNGVARSVAFGSEDVPCVRYSNVSM